MRVNSLYSVIQTEKLQDSIRFYRDNFGFQIVFESDWYASLKLEEGGFPFELALLDCSHETIPASFRRPAAGLILNFEVDDVDSEYERLVVVGKLPLERELRDEDFGQRHFIISDPNGILIDIIKIIPPSDEQSGLYQEQVW
ncbi:glyoxalase/bleomycin resistance/extradiol dioxygenase family protein [Paenibacillus sp. 1011MAR3C5]|uniref:VOC family protein n=1 Tax=Paenibacillus sp. 1011MAR3C5 TaxID=1675787 RepID=UPI000E6CF904|nr:VOC family protein [Paenibacillus sp. 1011MAR3C5]RJE89730.1 glyoxalase/bleomycin resistance/extradiol dioxygenase family protein [Paenibacillus sp. 1011MAR3C5]